MNRTGHAVRNGHRGARLGGLHLEILDGELAVARLAPADDLPPWLDWTDGLLVSVTRTGDEISVVCASDRLPRHLPAERGWRALKVGGALDFALTGILADLATLLAGAGVSLFAVSTFDTDCLLVNEESLAAAVRAVSVRHAMHGSAA